MIYPNQVANIKPQNSEPIYNNQNFKRQNYTPTRQQFQKGIRTQFQDEINSKTNTNINIRSKTNTRTHSEMDLKKISEIRDTSNKFEENALFEVFGIKLYFDDILLICLIFFLYNEGVQDQYLFIVLILLLLS